MGVSLRRSLLLKATLLGLLTVAVLPLFADAESIYEPIIATTTIHVSICGNSLVDDGEECDVPGETGAYSTTILGRQCSSSCDFGPYCGDAILQTLYGEECDDGNNDDGDFCAADCTVEVAGSGGGGSSGGGGGSSGGSNEDLGDTQISVSGYSFPGQTVHILLDSKEVGTVRADSTGKFSYATNASPGTVSMGFWATDVNRYKSITYNTTFDVTQGAITNVNGVLVPPTLTVDKTQFNPGETIVFSGQAIPNTKVEVHLDTGTPVVETTASSNGTWSVSYNTTGLSSTAHTARARYILGSGSVTTQSSYSTTIQLAAGVNGAPTSSSDLNRDGDVNLIDFSILIFWWGSAGGDSNPPADINGNGKVGLEDFSILLFNWTG
jgi:cysteine-rich repeat protein